jgi:hypothetical protein
MKITQKLLTGLMALLPLWSMTIAVAPAQAQSTASQYNARIDGFNVDAVRRLRPGAELSFDMYGTPGGRATIFIAGANRNLTLVETDPGEYHGTYTLGSRDKITPNSRVTANLRVGNQIASDVLSESLVRGPNYQRRAERMAANAMPRIERFDVVGDDSLRAGNELTFTVMGTPGAKVEMAISGARGVFFLPEVRPGEYTGAYTIRRADRIASNSAVTATMRYEDRVATAALNKPLLVAEASKATASPSARAAAALPAPCWAARSAAAAAVPQPRSPVRWAALMSAATSSAMRARRPTTKCWCASRTAAPRP